MSDGIIFILLVKDCKTKTVTAFEYTQQTIDSIKAGKKILWDDYSENCKSPK